MKTHISGIITNPLIYASINNQIHILKFPNSKLYNNSLFHKQIQLIGFTIQI